MLEKYNKGRVMGKKCFVIHEEVIDFSNEKYYICTIEKLSYNLSHFRIIGSMELENTRNDCFHHNT